MVIRPERRDDYVVDYLVQGYPGRSEFHGGLGWSSVSLIRGRGHVCLIDTGGFNVRPALRDRLEALAVRSEEVTDVLLTHLHYDHVVNYVLFPQATVWVSDAELRWAAGQDPSFGPVPELYVRELAGDSRVRRVDAPQEVLPGVHAMSASGHTPGSTAYYLRTPDRTVLWTGDAAKNRAELLGRAAGAGADREGQQASIASIWTAWRSTPGTILVPGHDVPMILNGSGEPSPVESRAAGLRAWLGSDEASVTHFDLTQASGSDGR